MNFKPKNLKVYVPNHGVIDKADFNETHLKACVKQVKEAGLNVEDYIRKHFEVVSYDNFPLFAEDKKTSKPKKVKDAPAVDETDAGSGAGDSTGEGEETDEEKLQRMIDDEEKLKGGNSSDSKTE